MKPLQLPVLQKILKEKKMTWIAKENPFALLSEEEKKSKLGLIDNVDFRTIKRINEQNNPYF